MNVKRFSLFFLLPVGALALASSGCEVSTCSGDDCDFSFDEDAGPDGSTGGDGDTTDSGTNPGDGDTDGGVPGDGDDAGPDAGDGDGDGDALASVDEFCDLQLEVGLDWATTFDVCCGTVPDEVTSFLGSALGYTDDASGRCADALGAPVTAGSTVFDGSKARACAEDFLDYYDVSDSMCPAAGFDLVVLAGQIGHGAPSLRQIPSCREAFAGKVKNGEQCTNGIECEADLRCRAMAGDGDIKGCLDPVGNGGSCDSNSDCDDGLTCLGAAGDGVCRPSDELSSVSAPCARTSQCAEGLICDAGSKTCVNATGGTLVCAH
jgi:hypothetical protein